MINVNRREFFKTAGAAAAGATLAGPSAANATPQQWTEKDKLARIASCSYPIRSIFKTRAGGRGANPTTAALKQKYGEITMLDFPTFTKEAFPGVTRMDIFSGLFGDFSDASMFTSAGVFDPSTPSGRRWLEKMAASMAKAGVTCQHISNNAPTDLAGPDEELRKAGVAVAKRWLDACTVLGVKSMRMNSPRALGPSIRPPAIPKGPGDGYPRNVDIEPLLAAAIESYKEMADHGGTLGIRVTIENHWGLAADPINIRTILDEVNHPYCEASPDFCNWEYSHMLVHGLKAVAPYAHTNVHAKYWDRWGDKNDVQRSTRIMLAAGFKGTFALEYEAGPLNGIEGAQYLYKEVLAALSNPVPII